jgi:hypothetical protein
MTNNDIAAIIEELRDLRIRELQILLELEETIRTSRIQQSNQAQGPTTTVHIDRNHRVDHPPVVQPPVTPTTGVPISAPKAQRPANTPNNDTDFQIGDRVYIINRLHRIRDRPPNKGDRISIVTGFLGDRVYITTLNNFETWRIATNLRRARSDE